MNYYEILDISRKSSQEEIVKAFRNLAKKYHPDINKNPDAKIKFIKIYEAYSILKDGIKRSVYDKITFGNLDEYQNKEETNKADYSGWQEAAREEANYYSEVKYKHFSEAVLKHLKSAIKTTKVIAFFFGAMILCGLFSIFVIRPKLAAMIEKTVSSSRKNNNSDAGDIYHSIVTPENSEENRSLPDGWERITIENIGSFDIPPTMELQGDFYKEIENDLMERIVKMESQNSRIVIQQKGLNDFNDESLSRYARVMFRTEEGDKGLTLDFNINEISQYEIAELNNLYRSATQMSFANTGLKLIEWYPLKIEKINGMSCMHTSYKRQLNTNEPVIVNNYYFFNYDYGHSLIMSYRLDEQEFWGEDFQIILNSLHIIKRVSP